MEDKKTGIYALLVLVALLVICMNLFAITVANNAVTDKQVTKIVADEIKKIKLDVPDLSVPTAAEIVALIPPVEIPEIESADNELLNEFLESEFEEEYSAIEDNATVYAFEELEDHDYRVIVKYLKTLLAEGEELDEDSIQIGNEDLDEAVIGDLEDVDVKVTKLGLGEDEDKSARVTFELEVEYELEEGVRDTFEIDLVVVYEVLFEEGDFDDEEVELVSIA